MPKYTNTKTGQVFNSPRPLTAEELQSVFAQGAKVPQTITLPSGEKFAGQPVTAPPVESPFSSVPAFMSNVKKGWEAPGGKTNAASLAVEYGVPTAVGMATGGLSLLPQIGLSGASMGLGNLAGNMMRQESGIDPQQSAGQNLTNAGIAAGVGGGLTGITAGLAPWIAQKGYMSALSPAAKLEPEERAAIARMGLQKANVGQAGYKKISDFTRTVGNQINQTVEGGTKAGNLVNVRDVANEVLGNLSKQAPTKTLPEDYSDAVVNFLSDFEKQHPEKLTPTEALLIKRDLGDQIRAFKTSGNIGSAQPSDQYTQQAKSALYFGMRDKLNDMFPALKTLNPTEETAINLREALARAYNKEGNGFLKSFGYPEYPSGILVGFGTGSIPEGIGAALAVRLMRSPYVQSAMMRALQATTVAGRPAVAATTAVGTQNLQKLVGQ